MRLKSLPKKIYNNRKADTKAVYRAIDAAVGGSISIVKESIAKSYQGFLDAKINNLILDMADNNIETDELINFINSKSHEDREFMSNLVIKSLHSDNRITTFLLAKLSKNKIKNGSLNYYESSLFTNINTFTHEDFGIYHYAIQHLIQPEKIKMSPYILVPLEDEHYILAINKFCSFGILQTAYTVEGSYHKEENQIYIFFFKTPYSDTLYQVLDEYFKKTTSS